MPIRKRTTQVTDLPQQPGLGPGGQQEALIWAKVEDVASRSANGAAARTAVLEILREELECGRNELRQALASGALGQDLVRAQADLVDGIIRSIYRFATEHLYHRANPSTAEVLSLVAVGGYGRAELAPSSDVDLLFLLPYKRTAYSEQVIEAVLYLLWDLKFKVGQATRTVDDCLRLAKADHTIRTNLLESRYLAGDEALFGELKKRYGKEVQKGRGADFIEAKLAERDLRHRRLGDSRYVLEPNIKDGKGGLRDLQTLFWIAKYVCRVDDIASLVTQGIFTPQEVRRFSKAQNFLWTLRCHLHYVTGRAEERLTFDLQHEIAPLMGYRPHRGTRAVERLMKHYFLVAKDVGALTRIFCATLAIKHGRRSGFRLPRLTRRRRIKGFVVEDGRLAVKDATAFRREPIRLLSLFKVAQQEGLEIHPQTLLWVTQNSKRVDRSLRAVPQANQIFLDILTSPKDPARSLRLMNEAGVMGRFLPEFGRVVAQMQYNTYHHYTVDEHTIFAIGVLHDIERGALAEEAPIATTVIHKVLSRRVLYLAVLLHDIAKGRGGDHSEIGGTIAEDLCPRLGLTAEETANVAWLVRDHLSMTDTAFKRDIDDPKTIEIFAERMQSLERLRLLLVLTVADIRAVGPGVWSAWKAALLRDLYYRTEEVLSGGLITEGRETRVVAAQDALRQGLVDWPAEEIDAHLARGYASYWLSHDTPTHLRHARLVREAEREGRPLTVATRADRYREVTEITIYTADHAGLFSRIAGALAFAGASIDQAKIITLANGMALDTFWVRSVEGGPFERPDKLARLATAIEQTLAGRLRPHQEIARRRSRLPSRTDAMKVTPRILMDNKASDHHTVIEVNGRDRPGLLYELTQALTQLGLQIHSAKISTYGEQVVDVFYVQNALANKIERASKLKEIHAQLTAILESRDTVDVADKKPSAGKAATSPKATPRKAEKQSRATVGAN